MSADTVIPAVLADAPEGTLCTFGRDV
jgi:hypothetical protein